MNRVIGLILAGLWSLPGVVAAEPLGLECPGQIAIPCTQRENLDITDRPVVFGGCGSPSVSFRDSVLAPDSLVIRIWMASDSCGAVAVCFQALTLIYATPRVAVLPLENLSSSEDGPRVLQRLLESALGESTKFQLIPPARVDDAIMRGRVRQPVLMDGEQRGRLSRMVDAQYFVVGSLLNYEVYQDPYSGPIPMISCALQLQRAGDGKAVWSESLHAVGNDGEWLFALGVEHDITRLGRKLARKAAELIAQRMLALPCAGIPE